MLYTICCLIDGNHTDEVVESDSADDAIAFLHCEYPESVITVNEVTDPSGAVCQFHIG
jgi:hypothetical protein